MKVPTNPNRLPMTLNQAEADPLLEMPREFVDLVAPLEFPSRQPMNDDRELRSTDHRELFLLAIERGNQNFMKLKYQTCARRSLV